MDYEHKIFVTMPEGVPETDKRVFNLVLVHLIQEFYSSEKELLRRLGEISKAEIGKAVIKDIGALLKGSAEAYFGVSIGKEIKAVFDKTSKFTIGLSADDMKKTLSSETDLYISTFKEVLEKTIDHKNVLIVIDQFERTYVKQLLLELVEKAANVKFIIGINNEPSEPDYVETWKYFDTKFDDNKILLGPLDKKGVAKWVGNVKEKRLTNAELDLAMERLGGIPYFISQWMKSGVDINKIPLDKMDKAKKLAEYRLKELEQDARDYALKMSHFLGPPEDTEVSEIFRVDVRNIHDIKHQLKDKSVFDNTGWFCHELLQEGIRITLPDREVNKTYNILADYYGGKGRIVEEIFYRFMGGSLRGNRPLSGKL